MTQKSRLGKSLHTLQKSLGFNAVRMARELHVPYPTYKCWIYGYRKPSRAAMRLLQIVSEELVEKWQRKQSISSKADSTHT
jgi:DNA-binding transcriptional regulator YiaG